MSDAQLLRDYWAGHAQFGPFEVGPDEFLRMFRPEPAIAELITSRQCDRDRAYQDEMRRG